MSREEQAIAFLIQNQAAFVQNEASFLSRLADADRRFARIEADLEQIKTILRRHEQILNNLVEAVPAEDRVLVLTDYCFLIAGCQAGVPSSHRLSVSGRWSDPSALMMNSSP